MYKNILYIAQKPVADFIVDELVKKGAQKSKPIAAFSQSIAAKSDIEGIAHLYFDFIHSLDSLVPYLKLVTPDLIVYDERGENNTLAVNAIKQIHDEIKQLSELWGPDFIFPMSRIFIVSKDEFNDRFVFDSGKLKIGDIINNPKRDLEVLEKIHRYFDRRSQVSQEFGIALSGGGIEGFLFQVGALYALETAIKGRKLTNAKVISGVSSGAIAGSMLAAKIPMKEIILSLVSKSEVYGEFKSSMIFDVATKDIAQRILKEQLSLNNLLPTQWLNKMLRSIPVGFLKGSTLEKYFRAVLESSTCKNKFSRLDTQLLIGATDHDTFKHHIFGENPEEDVPISLAIRASCSLPPFFTPIQINDRYYIDGQITKSCDLELCIHKGSKLCFILDPLMPYTQNKAGLADAEGGFYTSLQVVKAIMSSRFEESLRHVTERFPQVDFIIIQPDEICSEMMRGSPMRFRLRTKIIEFAFKGTLKLFIERHSAYSKKLGKYGFELLAIEDLQNHLLHGYPFQEGEKE